VCGKVAHSKELNFSVKAATGHCGGTLHSCGSEPAPFDLLPDKSGVPAESVRLDFSRHQGSVFGKAFLPFRLF